MRARRNQTTAHDIPIEQMLSSNDSFWIILATRQNGQMVTFFYAGQKLKWGKTKWKFPFCIPFAKGDFSLESGAIAPNVPP